jgi:hypothetical protein
MERLAISIFIRNEDDFIDEFFQYYISLGFTNFIILNDESSDDSLKIINFYKNLVNCTIIPVNLNEINRSIYNGEEERSKLFFHGLNEIIVSKYLNLQLYDYILQIDIDEFLYIKPNFCLIKYLNDNLKCKNSVILIPRINCGSLEDFDKNIFNLESLKYNYTDKIFTSCKQFCCPTNSRYFNGHMSLPINNTYAVSEIPNSQKDIKNNCEEYYANFLQILKKSTKEQFNLYIYHFISKNKHIAIKNKSKYRTNIGNSYRKNKESIHLLRKMQSMFTQPDNIILNYSKILFKRYYDKFGYLIIRNFIDEEIILKLELYIKENNYSSVPILEIFYKNLLDSNTYDMKLNDILKMLGIENIISFIPFNSNENNKLQIIPESHIKNKNTENFISINLQRQGILFMNKSLKYKIINKNEKNIRWLCCKY